MAFSNIQLLGKKTLNIRGARQFSHGGRRVLQTTVETVVKSYPVYDVSAVQDCQPPAATVTGGS